LRRQAKEARNAKQYEEAATLYRQLAALEPGHAATWFWLGWVLNALGNYGEALSALDACLELEHQRARVWNTRGYALYMLGRYQEALTCCDRVVTFEADNAAAWQNRAIVLQKLGKIEEMLAAYKRAAELQPTPLRLQRLIESYRSLGLQQEAQQYEARLRGMLSQHPAKPQRR
jgi:tetratricopeptide (TPR) repeat protein